MERMTSYEYRFQAEYCCCLQLVVTKILSVSESSKVASYNFMLVNYIHNICLQAAHKVWTLLPHRMYGSLATNTPTMSVVQKSG